MSAPAPRADEGAEPTELPHWERCIWCGAAPPFLGTCPKVPDGGRCGSLRDGTREHHNWCRLGMMPPAPLDTLCTCGQRPPDVRRGSSLHAAHCPRSDPNPDLPLTVSCECARPASSGDGGAPTGALCLAGNGGVLRCALPAGHDGDHRIGAEDVPAAPSPVPEEGPPKRPAMRWDGSRASLDRLCKWVNAGTDTDDPLLTYTFYTATDAWDVTLETASDFEAVEPGDWIVCDETGEFVVCRPATPEQGEGPTP